MRVARWAALIGVTAPGHQLIVVTRNVEDAILFDGREVIEPASRPVDTVIPGSRLALSRSVSTGQLPVSPRG